MYNMSDIYLVILAGYFVISVGCFFLLVWQERRYLSKIDYGFMVISYMIMIYAIAPFVLAYQITLFYYMKKNYGKMDAYKQYCYRDQVSKWGIFK